MSPVLLLLQIDPLHIIYSLKLAFLNIFLRYALSIIRMIYWTYGCMDLIMHVPAIHSVQVVAPDALHLPLVFRKGRDALAKVRCFLYKTKVKSETENITNLSQLVQAGAPTSAAVPFSQNSQSALPVASWYLPAAHNRQNVAFVFFGWYLPAEHNLHAESPGSSEKRPSEHFVHFIEAIPEYFPAELVVKEN